MYEIEIHRGAAESAAHGSGEAVAGFPVQTHGRGEIHLVMVGYRLVESVIRIADRQIERQVYTTHPVFEFRCGVHCEIIGVHNILRQSWQFGGKIGQLRVHRTEITVYSSFEAYRYPFYIKGVGRTLVGIEGMVGYLLPETFAVHLEV